MTRDDASAERHTSHYVHGTDPVEQTRLARLNSLLNAACLRELRVDRDARILDLGCGLGQFSRAMARAAGTTVVGVERSPTQLAEAARLAALDGESRLVDFRQGDAADPPLQAAEWGAFDVAHTRFLLEHVRDPLAVVRTLVRAVRPGGRIVLADDSHDVLRLWPAVPAFQRLWDAYVRSYQCVGNDPYVGHRLLALLGDAGAQPLRNNWLFFGSCAGEPEIFGAYIENLIGILTGVRELLLDLRLLDRPAFDEGLSAFQEWGHHPNAALWYALSWAEGCRPEPAA